jgi:hypothetical protein
MIEREVLDWGARLATDPFKDAKNRAIVVRGLPR